MPHLLKKLWIVAAVILLFGIGVLGWKYLKGNGYETVMPSTGKAVQAVYATGATEPVYWSMVSAHVTGRVEAIQQDEGSKVAKGALLATFDDSVEQAKVTELTARLVYLAKEMDRQLALSKRDYASARAYEQTVSEYNATKAQFEAQNELIGRMQITAPMEGTVLRREIEPGEIALQGKTIFWVGKPRPLRITAEVDEEDIPLVKLGQKVLIKADAYPQEIFYGKIAEITPKGDPVNKSFRVRISLPEDTKLLVGMTVEINIIAREEKDALLVPASSVMHNTVWKVKGSSIKKQKIIAGISDEEHVQIIKGITEKDSILLNPSLYLAEKQREKP